MTILGWGGGQEVGGALEDADLAVEALELLFEDGVWVGGARRGLGRERPRV